MCSGHEGIKGINGRDGTHGVDGQSSILTFRVIDANGVVVEQSSELYNLKVVSFSVNEGPTALQGNDNDFFLFYQIVIFF